MMMGLQMDVPLLISRFMEHTARYNGETEIIARSIEGDVFRYTYAEAHTRMLRMSQALARLNVAPGDRVGTLAWNTHRHFELFYGVSGMSESNPRPRMPCP